jgi:hypothetical protein
MAKKMKKIVVILISLLILMGNGCGQITIKTPEITQPNQKIIIPTMDFTNTPTIEESHTPKINSTTTPTLKSSATITTETDTTKVTPTIPPDAKLKIQCIDVAQEPPIDLKSQGILILDNRIGSTYFVDMTTSEVTQINQERELISGSTVSPRGDLLAYKQTLIDETRKITKENLVITDAKNENKRIFPWEKDWGQVVAWLDQQQILINIYPENPLTEPLIWYVLNPFTGEHKILKPEYPDIYSFPPIPMWNGWGETVYDPGLSLVVYLRGGPGGSLDPYNYVLRDVENQIDLADIEIIGNLNAIPRWNFDGTEFTVAQGLAMDNQNSEWPSYEVLVVNRKGEISQKSNLKGYYPWTYISDLSWSPDGKYIAFWFTGWMERPKDFTAGQLYLAVMDASSGFVINYCIPGEASAQIEQPSMVPPTLWSPDGKQLVVENLYGDILERKSRVIFVDLEKNQAAIIAQDLEPKGWMNTP